MMLFSMSHKHSDINAVEPTGVVWEPYKTSRVLRARYYHPLGTEKNSKSKGSKDVTVLRPK